MSIQDQSLQSRADKYATSSAGYEGTTYGAAHLQFYRQTRNEEIGRALAESFPQQQPLRILEVGCGTGLVLDYLCSLGAEHEVLGCDASEAMLDKARQRFEGRPNSPTLAQASCDDLPFPDGYCDVVVATRFIHLFSHEEKKHIYDQFRRVLKDGGIIVIEYYSRPVAWVRYYLGGRRKREVPSAFFSHYPTAKQVRDIVGHTYTKRPVRVAGSRILFAVLGNKLLTGLVRCAASVPGLNLLVDEYLVVTRK